MIRKKICIRDGKRCLKILLITTTKNNSIAHAKGKEKKNKNPERMTDGQEEVWQNVQLFKGCHNIIFHMSLQITLAFT